MRITITRDQYDAVLLDLDGVITDTANIHAACWKQMFNEYLQKRAAERGEPFRPFDLTTDYRLYVDGKPRFDGVRDFLTSHGTDSGEGRWTIKAAIDEGVPVPSLATALYQRFTSRREAAFEDKLVSAMRFGFGGHLEKPAK